MFSRIWLSAVIALLAVVSHSAFKLLHRTCPQRHTSMQQFSGAKSGEKESIKKLFVEPIAKITGEITLPGSKSLSNRVLLLAALSKGTTKVENLLDSADIRYMLAALKQLNIPIEEDKEKKTAVLTGRGGTINVNSKVELNLGNAGTAMRPLAGVLCAGQGEFVLDGTPRMRERPIDDLVDGLKVGTLLSLPLSILVTMNHSTLLYSIHDTSNWEWMCLAAPRDVLPLSSMPEASKEVKRSFQARFPVNFCRRC